VSTGTVKIWYHAEIVSGQRYNDKESQVSTSDRVPDPHPAGSGTAVFCGFLRAAVGNLERELSAGPGVRAAACGYATA
jgi:hypothetical protein